MKGGAISLTTHGRFFGENESDALDWSRIEQYLRGFDLVLNLEQTPRQFSSGMANLNYLVNVNDEDVVLRRPPLGVVAPGAHDMVREYRVLSRLWVEFPLAPRAFHLCENTAVAGAPFFLMEYRPGVVVGASMPAQLLRIHESKQQRKSIGAEIETRLLQVMHGLHEVDPAAVSLERLGRPELFYQRQLKHWNAAAANVGLGKESCQKVSHWLDQHQPSSRRSVLIHNDFKIDNLALDAKTLEPVALFDWDLCTRADPLFDLAVCLSYWEQPHDDEAMRRLRQMPTAQHGFSSRDGLIQRYAQIAGDNLDGLTSYRVLAGLRLAVIYAQLSKSSRSRDNARFQGLGDLADDLLTFALSLCKA